MIKKIALIITILIATFSFAQENTGSPYSFYGIGLTKFNGTNDIVNMGGISVYSDSTHINILNPASYSNQFLTSFQLGATSSFYKLNANSTKEKAQKTSFDYLVMGFPVTKKLGVSAGILPQSAVGYRFVNDKSFTDGTVSKYQGKGGVNKVYIGSGYKLTNKMSIGLDFQYLFGTINTEAYIFKNGVLNGSKEVNESSVSGVGFNIGLTYNTKLNKKLNLMSSITYSPKFSLNSNNTRNTNLVALASDGTIAQTSEVKETIVADTKLNLPSKLTIGAGIGNRKWFLGGDVAFSGTGNQLNRFENYANVKYENSTKIAIGGFIIPKFNSFDNYLERITYRTGFKYENTGLVINNESINEKSFSLGFGLPITGSFSNINIGFEYGERGTVLKGLVREDYFSVSVGLIFNDKWFRKTLYN